MIFIAILGVKDIKQPNIAARSTPNIAERRNISEFYNNTIQKVDECKTKCHELANCSWPDICECPPGYEGDGKNICRIPRPHAYNAKLIKYDNNTKHVDVKYTGVIAAFEPKNVFCKIGNQISKALYYEYQHVVCDGTDGYFGQQVAVGFEKDQFGDTTIVGISSIFTEFVLFGLIAFLVSCLGVFMYYFKNDNKQQKKFYDETPLVSEIGVK